MHQPLSRSQLAEMTGLQNSTLSHIFRELIAKGLVQSVGKRSSGTVGPKHNMLTINPDVGWVLGVLLSRWGTRMAMLDFAGKAVGGHEVRTEIERLEDVPAKLSLELHRWAERAGEPPGKLLGIGVGVSGSVDPFRGIVLFSNEFDARNVPLREMIAEECGVNVLIDHDANIAAVAEAKCGVGKSMGNFLYVLINVRWQAGRFIDSDHGASLYLDGGIYRGAHFAAGELDESMLPPKSPIEGQEQIDALRDPDAPLPDALRQWARDVGRALSRLTNFIDPEAIVLGGSLAIRNRSFLAEATDQMHQLLIPIKAHRTINLLPSAFGDDCVSVGAAITAAEEAYLTGDIL